MQRARMLGNYVQNLAEKKGLTNAELREALDCQENQLQSFLKGRSFLPFTQISSLADLLGVTVSDLLEGDPQNYNETVVHCMNQFQNASNREKILDIIDEYMDIRDAVM